MFKFLGLWFRQQRFILLNAILFFLFSELFVQLVVHVGVQPYLGHLIEWQDFCRMDCHWYLSILHDGYDLQPHRHPLQDAANWSFFPVFPLIALSLKQLLVLNASIALIVTSKIFFLLSIMVFMLFVKHQLGEKAMMSAGLMVAFNPYLIYAHAGYNETLYFFLTTLAFWALQKHYWLRAGLAGAILSATRVVGVIFSLAYLFANLKHYNKFADKLNILIGLGLIPLGLATYMLYLYWQMGDALTFSHIQISWGRVIVNPYHNIIRGLMSLNWNLYYTLYVLLAFAISLWFALKKEYAYTVFILVVTLIPLSTGLVSLPRYIMWQMPVVLGLLELLMRFKYLRYAYWVLSLSVAIVITFFWFSRTDFIV